MEQMSSSKVLVFGSFSEDEARLFQSQSVRDEKKPWERGELQFGSLDFAAVSSLGGFNVESKQRGLLQGSNVHQKVEVVKVEPPKREKTTTSDSIQGISSNGSAKGYSYCSLHSDEKREKTTTGDNIQGISVNVESNGNTKGNCYCSAHSDGERQTEDATVKLNSMTISQNRSGLPKLPENPRIHVFEDEKSTDINLPVTGNSIIDEFLVDSSTVMAPQKLQRTSNERGMTAKALLPRGLINSGNLCFLNACLQALLSCSPFVQLLQELRTRNIPKIGYPTLCAFVELISDFDMPTDSSLKKNEKMVLETGRPFSPIMFDTVLKNFTPDLPTSTSGRPRQEDAQEFLSFLMDQMHDELLKLDGHLSSSDGGKMSLMSSMEDEDWETVGPKNKSAVTRIQSFMPSELSCIFGGQLRSVVKARGNKASATVQPYLLLHLDIFPEAVHTIEDALRLFSAPEMLEGYRTSTGKAGLVTASKSVKIQTLSKMMILHLMRFSYGSRGSTKLLKPVRFPLELFLGRELLVSSSAEGRKYELVATITHHGREPSKGHYTADARYSDGRWLRYDDASVANVGINKVLHDQAYVLFYRQI